MPVSNIGYSPATSTRPITQEYPEQREDRPSAPVVEVLTPYGYDSFSSGNSRDSMSGIWSRTLRLKITGRNGLEKLDVRIPVSFSVPSHKKVKTEHLLECPSLLWLLSDMACFLAFYGFI